ncbi:MAG: NAD(P)/FAD-dependent oxidoreductase [Bacteroidota bacterium]
MKVNLPETGQKRIVIIGGGFAGLSLARKIAKLDYQVVVIDKNNYHQFQPLFYQVAMAGLEPSSISFPLRKVFQKQPNVFIRITTVESVDTDKKQLQTPLGILNYDFLVLAIGADTNFFGNQKIARHAIPMKSVSEALYLRNELLTHYETALSTPDFDERQGYVDIVIVGGGPTGVEVAGALAEMRKYILPKDYHELDAREVDIYLIQAGDALLKGMSKKASEAAEKFLVERGVIVKKNTRVTDFDGEFVFMNDDTKIRARKVVWAAGITGNKIEGFSPDVFAYCDRLRVNALSQIKGFEDIFAIGDIAYMETEAYPQGHPQVAQVAIQQGRALAKNFKRLSKEKTLVPFKYKDLGTMATIGRNRAVCDLPNVKFQGRFAWYVWLWVHLFALIGTKNKLFVFLNWLWNYLTYDQSLRLIIKPEQGKSPVEKEEPVK